MENAIHVQQKPDVVNVIHHQMHALAVLPDIIYHQEVVPHVQQHMVIVVKHVTQPHVQHVYQIYMHYQEQYAHYVVI